MTTNTLTTYGYTVHQDLRDLVVSTEVEEEVVVEEEEEAVVEEVEEEEEEVVEEEEKEAAPPPPPPPKLALCTGYVFTEIRLFFDPSAEGPFFFVPHDAALRGRCAAGGSCWVAL
jgi:hypothetical protein